MATGDAKRISPQKSAVLLRILTAKYLELEVPQYL
jgi:hypothetical protein